MNAVSLVEVGPRDGLQNEPDPVPAETKARFIEALAHAGHRRIEATSFVSPRAIPQLADAEETMSLLRRAEGVTYMALVPNERGFDRALAARMDEVAVFTAVSETFNKNNIRATVDESLQRFKPVIARARAASMSVRGYVSTCLHCPYDGPVDPADTVRLTRRLLDLGCREVSLGETTGRATPGEVRELCQLLHAAGLLEHCAGHFHDTYGMGVANVLAAWEEGIRVFDASAGGLGGCPFAPGAAGNVATEDVVFLFEGMGVETGIDLDRLVAATGVIEEALGDAVRGRTFRALKARCPRR